MKLSELLYFTSYCDLGICTTNLLEEITFDFLLRTDNDCYVFLPYHLAQDKENEIVTEGSAVVHGEPSQDGSVPPKVDSEAEVLDEKVSKQIIKEGHGSKPSKYSTCFCK